MYYENFERLCKAKGVTPAEVSRNTGIATSTLTNWKKGSYTPKIEKLQKIADYFGVPVDYLLNVEKNRHLKEYYVDEETAKIAQRIFETKGMRTLFDAAEDASPEDLEMAAQLLRRLKQTNPDG